MNSAIIAIVFGIFIFATAECNFVLDPKLIEDLDFNDETSTSTSTEALTSTTSTSSSTTTPSPTTTTPAESTSGAPEKCLEEKIRVTEACTDFNLKLWYCLSAVFHHAKCIRPNHSAEVEVLPSAFGPAQFYPPGTDFRKHDKKKRLHKKKKLHHEGKKQEHHPHKDRKAHHKQSHKHDN